VNLSTLENQSVVGSFHFTHNVKAAKEKYLKSYSSNTKIWPVNQILNNMGKRRRKHNYEEGKKSVISIQIVQNEYLIRIFTKYEMTALQIQIPKQDEHTVLGKEIRRNSIGEEAL